MKSPVREIQQIIKDSGDPGYTNRVLVATPSAGTVRMEWVMARYGQSIPANWSQVQLIQWINGYVPLRFQVADAQNLIVKEVLDKDMEWLLLVEDDVILPPNTFMAMNEYMREGKTPIVSGLYFTRSEPSEPLIYRGRGNSYYTDWQMGDKVWVDGVPTGILLVHHSILKVMWDESEEYIVGGTRTRKVFETPIKTWYDEATGQFNTTTGTSDLEWCSRIIKEGVFKKAGWEEFENKKHPFLMDTRLFCRHIDRNTGITYPDHYWKKIDIKNWKPK
jgi:hypothetical protein